MADLKRRDLLLWPVAAGFALSPLARAQAPAGSHDWLEAVEGQEALSWVDSRSGEALALIEAEPNFARRKRETLRVLSTGGNLSIPTRVGDHLYHFFRSANRPHGLWRRTTLENFSPATPRWETLLNVDELAKQEQRNITLAFYNVHAESQRALVLLTSAGEDKLELREFDLASRSFVADGFRAPTAKMSVTWLAADELLIATDTGPDSMTESGYAVAVRRWKRGTPLLDAPVVLRGERADMAVAPTYVRREGLPTLALLQRRVRFHESDAILFEASGRLTKVDAPRDANVWLEQDWIMASLRTPWTTGGRTYPEGSLLAWPASQPNAADRSIQVLLEGRDRRRLVFSSVVKDGFVVSSTDNLLPRVEFLRLQGGALQRTRMPAPEHGVVRTWGDRARDGNRFWMLAQAPLQPLTLTLVDPERPQEAVLEKQQNAVFDGAGLHVQQFEVRSRDGTPVPYTVVGPAERKPGAPTLLVGYGGFGISSELEYQQLAGVNWLQYGGTMVIAHIRGGGEFGPNWHLAAKGLQRQVGFNDFIAVAEDLVARGITEPRRLGIYGASNGGALVTAVLVQRPELFGAVVSRVPLTDMLGFTRLFAGPSWVEEYGDPGREPDRAVLARWSPYQNVVKASAARPYPPVLFIGNRNDDRVHPAHARKMAARLRELGHEHTWLYEEKSGGHLGRSDPRIHAQREALLYSFLWQQLTR